MQSMISKILLSLTLTTIAFLYAFPNFVDDNFWIRSRQNKVAEFIPQSKVNLGLDLMGGSHLLLDVDVDNYMTEIMVNIGSQLKKSLRQEKIFYKRLLANKDGISFEVRDPQDNNKIIKIIHKIDPTLLAEYNLNKVVLKYSKQKLDELRDRVIERSIEIIRLRVDSGGTKEPIIQKQGERHILLQVPGENNPEELKKLLGKTAKLGFHLVENNIDLSKISKDYLSPDLMLVYTEKNTTQDSQQQHYLAVKRQAVISGDQLIHATARVNQQNNQVTVAFELNNIGGKTFAEVTKNNIGKQLAIVLDNKLLSAPRINSTIVGGSGEITGNFTIGEANELALLLRAGALPAPLKTVEERSIGPNLGHDSIAAGKKAGVIGFIAVAIFMVLTYGVLGIFANIALSLALLYILAILSALQATLTLPGIAGVILTIGMAVDANVLIYERIREELKKGASKLYAVKVGFQSAFATITDSNITTLIVAIMLYVFGIGAIKGFAVALSIGIIASMFTAIVITKLLIDIWLKYFHQQQLGL